MQLWADVYSTDGVTRLGSGPIPIKSATITRALDEAGSYSFDVPGTDARAADLLQNKRRVRIFRLDPSTQVIRELGRGIIEKRSAKISAGGIIRTIAGPDNLAELKFKSVLLNRIYDNEPVTSVTDQLLALVGGWSRSGTVSNVVHTRFDGVSVLKALQNLMSQQGVHFRQSSTPNTLEIGTFGASNGLRVHNAVSLGNEFYTNDKVLLIDNLTLAEESTDIVNWLLPVGAGRGEASVTLELATLGTPYGIQQTVIGGNTLYFTSDAASIATYGMVQKVGSFKDVTPISTSEQAQIDAANALYTLQTAWLVRNKDPYTSYTLAVKNVQSNLQPGDKIRLAYKGWITDVNGDLVDQDDIDSEFWILEVKETYNESGGSANLKIASVDRYAQDTERIIIGAIESIVINNTVVEPSFNGRGYVYSRTMDSTHSAEIPVEFTSTTSRLMSCTIRLVTRPFRSTATAAGSDGGSTATSAAGGGQTSSGSGILNTGFELLTNPPSFSQHYHALATHDHTVSNHQHSVDIPNHTHPLTYAIADNSEYPTGISISIDGVDCTTSLFGGKLATGGGSVNEAYEIADYLNQTTLQGQHTVTLTCDSGSGEAEITTSIWEIIQSIAAA